MMTGDKFAGHHPEMTAFAGGERRNWNALRPEIDVAMCRVRQANAIHLKEKWRSHRKILDASAQLRGGIDAASMPTQEKRDWCQAITYDNSSK